MIAGSHNVTAAKMIGILRLTVLHFIALHGRCVVYKLKVCGNAALSKSIGANFPTAFAHPVSLHRILVILSIGGVTCFIAVFTLLR